MEKFGPCSNSEDEPQSPFYLKMISLSTAVGQPSTGWQQFKGRAEGKQKWLWSLSVEHSGNRFAGTGRLCLYLQQIIGFEHTNTRSYWNNYLFNFVFKKKNLKKNRQGFHSGRVFIITQVIWSLLCEGFWSPVVLNPFWCHTTIHCLSPNLTQSHIYGITI